MSTHTKVVCDIKGCGASPATPRKMPIVFTTERTEGRPFKPHFSNETLDLCDACFQRLIDEFPIYAHGAQGYNTYYFKERKKS